MQKRFIAFRTKKKIILIRGSISVFFLKFYSYEEPTALLLTSNIFIGRSDFNQIYELNNENKNQNRR